MQKEKYQRKGIGNLSSVFFIAKNEKYKNML